MSRTTGEKSIARWLRPGRIFSRGAGEAAAVLRRDEVIRRAPDRHRRHAWIGRRQSADPGAVRLHLPRILAQAVVSEPGPVVRGAECYQLRDPARSMPAQICTRREAAHAVPNERNLIRPRLRAQRFDPRVQLIGKPVDAPERRFEVDGGDGKASGLQFAAQPPPGAPIAQIAVDQQDRDSRPAAGAPRRHHPSTAARTAE